MATIASSTPTMTSHFGRCSGGDLLLRKEFPKWLYNPFFTIELRLCTASRFELWYANRTKAAHIRLHKAPNDILPTALRRSQSTVERRLT
jgi:hypothetical protein